MMNKKLSCYFIQLTQDACLKAFWRRDALKSFLQVNGIKQNVILSWSEGETKATFLRRLFASLLEQKDLLGHKAILKMARDLSEMKTFPDLLGWVDSDTKIQEAYKSIERLKSELVKLQEQLATEEKKEELQTKAKIEREQKIHSCQTIEKFQERLLAMMNNIGRQEGGYDFENWIYEFAVFNDITARKPYRDVNGRQIDGAVTIDGTTFLIEAKFVAKPIGSQDIDIFYAKVKKKADNTMGLLIAINGFLPEAIKTASCDRTPLLLMDGNHFFNIIFLQRMTLKETIQRILVHASQTGKAYLPVTEFNF